MALFVAKLTISSKEQFPKLSQVFNIITFKACTLCYFLKIISRIAFKDVSTRNSEILRSRAARATNDLRIGSVIHAVVPFGNRSGDESEVVAENAPRGLSIREGASV